MIITFITGLLLGTCAGIVVMSLVQISRCRDRGAEDYFSCPPDPRGETAPPLQAP